MKLNAMRSSSIDLDMPQHYSVKLVERLESAKRGKKQV